MGLAATAVFFSGSAGLGASSADGFAAFLLAGEALVRRSEGSVLSATLQEAPLWAGILTFSTASGCLAPPRGAWGNLFLNSSSSR
ncbi:uncharacterized protein TrAtP1_006414 [Trichoderma atroviride]|uniref:uncharacterized protein n=1 Tax=Hypocrea atroviridis TaxID=63577 RepID=UPI003326434B|nr:hypothetical protein TrAtP1_006414 [Trichoderma atroviride]